DYYCYSTYTSGNLGLF
nr:immunoglobulin light chain junction region [Macaca mulatta]MOX42402.1 immunoglobulin light chain junction region [Macaca mulatta]MOX42982.1 immunoglobulin light chain junction region [Macaca mulatta]MOX43542.1 immunoglobulin light chain junction region [Macaca mulatta]MOX43774.1 immunoglobulin light chain junction region [Macaca mulatta]